MGFGETLLNLGGNGWNYVNKSLDNAAQTTANCANHAIHMDPIGAWGSLGQGAVNQVKLGGQMLQNQWHAILGGDQAL